MEMLFFKGVEFDHLLSRKKNRIVFNEHMYVAHISIQCDCIQMNQLKY